MHDATAGFEFHDGVRQFLEPGNRGRGKWPRTQVRQARKTGHIDYPADRAASLKDAIEALGVPHTEVGRITVNGHDVDFGYQLAPGLNIHVYPIPSPVDVTRPQPLRPVPLPRVAFVVDANVGKLSPLLRMLGLDTAYGKDWTDAEIARTAHDESRIVLTRDRALLKRSAITHARLVRTQTPRHQLLEVITHFGLTGPFGMFSRCLRCNDVLSPVPKAEILHRLEPLTKRHFHSFSRCPACDRIYWQGSHHAAMLDWLREAGVKV